MYCQSCNQSKCNDIEGNFDCLGLPNKTTVTDLVNRVKERYCEDCIPPTIELESSPDNTLSILLTNKGSAKKITVEIYSGESIYKTIRLSDLGVANFVIPFGEYRIRVFDTYNFECSTGYIKYSHQSGGDTCIAPIVSLTSTTNPSNLVINLISLGESSSVTFRIFREDKLVNTITSTKIDTFKYPVTSGLYKVVVVATCTNGETVQEFTIRIIDNKCDLVVAQIDYDCETRKVTANVTGGSLQYEYSINGINWVTDISTLSFQNNRTYGLYIRDKNNTSCFTYREFLSICKCQLSVTASEIQCNVLECKLILTYSEAECSNTLICTINGTINIT